MQYHRSSGATYLLGETIAAATLNLGGAIVTVGLRYLDVFLIKLTVLLPWDEVRFAPFPESISP